MKESDGLDQLINRAWTCGCKEMKGYGKPYLQLSLFCKGQLPNHLRELMDEQGASISQFTLQFDGAQGETQ